MVIDIYLKASRMYHGSNETLKALRKKVHDLGGMFLINMADGIKEHCMYKVLSNIFDAGTFIPYQHHTVQNH
jgi:hypothetical protein